MDYKRTDREENVSLEIQTRKLLIRVKEEFYEHLSKVQSSEKLRRAYKTEHRCTRKGLFLLSIRKNILI